MTVLVTLHPYRGRMQLKNRIYDTNYWKSFVHTRWVVPMGDKGGLSLFGQKDRNASGLRRAPDRRILNQDRGAR